MMFILRPNYSRIHRDCESAALKAIAQEYKNIESAREHCIDISEIGLVTDKYSEMRASLVIFAGELLIAVPDAARRKVC